MSSHPSCRAPDDQSDQSSFTCDAQGVDRSLIRAALDRTPTECLELLEEILELGENAHRVDEPLR